MRREVAGALASMLLAIVGGACLVGIGWDLATQPDRDCENKGGSLVGTGYGSICVSPDGRVIR